jgi:hypothetical protein
MILAPAGSDAPAVSQSLMALAALLNNFFARPAGGGEKIHFCELGCGPGVNALVTAAANPGWQVTGIAGDPAHIAAARGLAAAAGIGNARFIEAGLADFGFLVPFDVVSIGRLWSSLAPDEQGFFLRLLGQKLKPGGLCQVSYHLATYWQGAVSLQRLVREAGLRGIAVAKALAGAGAVAFAGPAGENMLENPETLGDDLLNPHWRPLPHADVAAAMAGEEMQFAGSACLIGNVAELSLSAAQRAVLAHQKNPVMPEMFKDICHPAPLRHDVFIRGARRITNAARDAVLAGVTLGLAAAPEDWRFAFAAAGGMASMEEGFYRPIFDRLQDGPATLAELTALPGLAGERGNLAELIAVAIGTGHAAALPNPGAAMNEACRRLNTILLRRGLAAAEQVVRLALPALGGGIFLPRLEALRAMAAADQKTLPWR